MIDLTNFFTLYKHTPANIAKKRLKIIVAEHKTNREEYTPNYLPQLKQDILKVICKYTQIHSKTILFKFTKKNNNTSVLSLIVTLKKEKSKTLTT